MSKYFIITVDTEGENGWTYKRGDEIHTECSKFVPCFQALCDKYGFKPVYLTNYEMICNDDFATFLKDTQNEGKCEVGIHIHAWNTPPAYELSNYVCDQTFLIEYPQDIMRAKFKTVYDLITQKIGVSPVSHRAGRWVMNEKYWDILQEFNIKVDCSHTPYIDWSSTIGGTMGGTNYRKCDTKANYIRGILEVPMTIELCRKWLWTIHPKRFFRHIRGEVLWMRPAMSTIKQMKTIVDKNKNDYVEFMVHSSELMPGGSPYFQNIEAIERLYMSMESVFKYATEKGYVGCTLKDYYAKKN